MRVHGTDVRSRMRQLLRAETRSRCVVRARVLPCATASGEELNSLSRARERSCVQTPVDTRCCSQCYARALCMRAWRVAMSSTRGACPRALVRKSVHLPFYIQACKGCIFMHVTMQARAGISSVQAVTTQGSRRGAHQPHEPSPILDSHGSSRSQAVGYPCRMSA